MVEVRSLTDTFHLESGLPERPLYQRYQEVDLSCRGRGAGESRLQVKSIDIAAGDQRSATG